MKAGQPISTERFTASNNNLLVSIIIPCRKEEKFISTCIESIMSNTFPGNKMDAHSTYDKNYELPPV